jgi:dipeptidyl-peptidase-4
VPEYSLVNYTDAMYPVIFKYPYPKAGQANAAVRVGVVGASCGPTRWIKAPATPAISTSRAWNGRPMAS